MNQRTRVRRLPEKQVSDVEALHAVLDAALVAHVAVPQEHRLAVIPVGMARDGDRLLIHGSTGSQAFRALADGIETCATVTLLDGIVVARSQFESSMHYRCAMLFGSFTPVPAAERATALAVLSEHLLPGLTGARPPSAKELAATSVLAMPLTEWSLKVSAADPEDAEADLDRPVWAGVVPLQHTWGTPIPAPDLAVALPAPTALADWPTGRA
ncbi:MAG TPA: pyridoxamine 5'-phosphate oxidase family protein [Kineosporiaceae bacterium]|nr:pyridoxamine 5'-phosphate oxidase family protein [Kineosporiaceae bacterium]